MTVINHLTVFKNEKSAPKLLKHIRRNLFIMILEARYILCIIHPNRRFKKLKGFGYIITSWRIVTTPKGKAYHPKVMEKMPSKPISIPLYIPQYNLYTSSFLVPINYNALDKRYFMGNMYLMKGITQ